jgi:hypothetical protein
MKQPLRINSRGWDAGGGNYFKEVLTELNLSFKVVPSPFTAVMIASAIPAAIRAYSIPVGPDSSDQSLDNMLLTSRLHSIPKCVVVPKPGTLGNATFNFLTEKLHVIGRDGNKSSRN